MSELLRQRVVFSISDPWELTSERGALPHQGTIVEVSGDRLLLRLDKPIRRRDGAVRWFVASPRHKGTVLTDLLTSAPLNVNLAGTHDRPSGLTDGDLRHATLALAGLYLPDPAVPVLQGELAGLGGLEGCTLLGVHFEAGGYSARLEFECVRAEPGRRRPDADDAVDLVILHLAGIGAFTWNSYLSDEVKSHPELVDGFGEVSMVKVFDGAGDVGVVVAWDLRRRLQVSATKVTIVRPNTEGG